VPLRADDRQPAFLDDALAQLDVGASARHVGGDGDGAGLPRLRHDLGLLFGAVLLGIEDVVGDALALQAAAQHLRHVHRRGADQDRLAPVVVLLDFLDDGVVLLAARLEKQVVLVVADDRLVGGDDDHVHVVDVVELLGLRLGRAGHAGELVVHPKVVLERDLGVGLRGLLHLDLLLGLDGLVKALRVAPPLQDAPGVLVDDLHLAVLDDVLGVFLVQGVGLQQLLDGVEALGALRIRRVQLAPGFLALLFELALVVHDLVLALLLAERVVVL